MTDPATPSALVGLVLPAGDVQYKTDVSVAARQSIYEYQRPPIGLPREILGLAGLSGHEVGADIGCGNGRYLAELARRGHSGPLVGADLSPGMLLAAGVVRLRLACWSPARRRCHIRDAAADLTWPCACCPRSRPAAPPRCAVAVRAARLIDALNGAGHLRGAP